MRAALALNAAVSGAPTAAQPIKTLWNLKCPPLSIHSGFLSQPAFNFKQKAEKVPSFSLHYGRFVKRNRIASKISGKRNIWINILAFAHTASDKLTSKGSSGSHERGCYSLIPTRFNRG